MITFKKGNGSDIYFYIVLLHVSNFTGSEVIHCGMPGEIQGDSRIGTGMYPGPTRHRLDSRAAVRHAYAALRAWSGCRHGTGTQNTYGTTVQLYSYGAYGTRSGTGST